MASLEQTPPTVNRATVKWTHQVDGNLPIDVLTEYYTNLDTNTLAAEMPVIILPGYGEKEWAARRALQVCDQLGVTAVVPIVNMEQVPATRQDLSHFVHNFAALFADQMRQRHFRAGRGICQSAIGHSMGGGLLGLGLHHAPELFDDVAFLEPVGHDTARRLDQSAKPLNQFKWQLARVALNKYNDITVADFYHAATGLVGQVISDHWPPYTQRFSEKVRLPLALDCGPAVLTHATQHNVAYVFGQHDPLVNGHHVIESLRLHVADNAIDQSTGNHPGLPDYTVGLDRIKFVFTDQPHSYMGWNHGAKHLRLSLETLNLVKSEPMPV